MNVYVSISFLFISIITAKYRKRGNVSLLVDTFSLFLYLIFTIIYLAANFFTNHGIDETVIYTLQYGLGKAGFGDYVPLIFASTSALIVIFVISYIYYKVIKRVDYPKTKRIKGAIHINFMLLAFAFHPFLHNLYTIYSYRSVTQSGDFYKYYKKPPRYLKLSSKKNLVYIYAESLEKTYFDKRLFPDLLTRLEKIRDSAVEFDNIKQIVGSGWTIGGMVTSQCGIPLFSISQGNSMSGMDSYLNGAVCFGDTLKGSGYHLAYIQGADTKFSGKDKFYRTHSFDEIYGREELKGRLKDKNYLNAWGLYDDSTFDIAFEKYEKLSKNSIPFALFVMTLDTHHPEGHISKRCRDLGIKYGDGKNSILNAVKCSDYLISSFIEEIKESPYAKNTLIVLSSDHLAMKNTATSILDRGKRRDTFLIIDPSNSKHQNIDKNGTMLDVVPTLLYKLGADIDYYGLGRNLFKEESLIEKFENFNKTLYSWRGEILKFWNFPTVGKEFEIDQKKKKVSISWHEYSFPVLFRIKKDNILQPMFEFYSDKTLPEFLLDFNRDDTFIWIDLCAKISYLLDKNSSEKYCVAEGRLDGNISFYELSEMNEKLSIDIEKEGKIGNKKFYKTIVKKLHDLNSIKISIPSFYSTSDISYDASPDEGIDFSKKGYPSFIKSVWGISSHEEWGRWSDANLYSHVKIVFKKRLPSNFTLLLKMGSYGDNFSKSLPIKIGSIEKRVKLSSRSPKLYRKEFLNVDSDTIELYPPYPSFPKTDRRKIGVFFVSLRIIDNE